MISTRFYFVSMLVVFVGGLLSAGLIDTSEPSDATLACDDAGGHAAVGTEKRLLSPAATGADRGATARADRPDSDHRYPFAGRDLTEYDYAAAPDEFDEPLEEELLAELSEDEILSQADEDDAIAEELERLELEHGDGQHYDGDARPIEMSATQLDDERFNLELATEREMESLELDESEHEVDAELYGALEDGTGVDARLTEFDMELQRLDMENAIQQEMDLLEVER